MKNFNDRSLSLAPGLTGTNKINFGLIKQAFNLREKLVSQYFSFIYACVFGYLL